MKKSGHADIASSRRMCQTLIEDANEIIAGLPTDEEATLPTWWTNKLAVSSAYVNSLRDYLIYSSEESEMSEEESEDEEEMEESENEDEEESKSEMMNESAENSSENDTQQITVGDYTTKHFDICPSARALYSSIRGRTNMIHLIVETMMLQDLLFRLEKQAIAMGSIDEEELEKAEEFAELIMENAEKMNLTQEHAYINDVHMAKFKQLAGVSMNSEEEDDEEEEDDDMLPPSARMMKYASKTR